jgi:hypothetical protein
MTKTLIYGIIALVIVIVASLIAFTFNNGTQNGSEESTQGGFFDSLFPFDFNNDDTPLIEGSGDDPQNTTELAAPTLRKVSEDPVSGGFLFEHEGETRVRFIDRATGHLYETVATSTLVDRITNTTVPGIQEMLWVDENTFIVRYLNGDTPETFLARLVEDAEEEQRLNGIFLDSYTRAALDPQKDTLFGVYSEGNGSSLVVSDLDGTNAREVLASPLSSWVPLQSEAGLFVYSAPLSGVNGYLYQINGGALIKVAGGILGMTAQISPSGQYALVSGARGGEVSLALINIETGQIYESPLNTLSDKCVFDRQNETQVYCGIPEELDSLTQAALPNDWLLGRVGFTDAMWRISFERESATFVSALDDTSEAIDVVNLSMNEENTHLLFTNKNDLSLWSLQIREPIIEESDEENEEGE